MEVTNKAFAPITSWSTDDRPREKMLQNGLSSLSNSELLAILINTGSKERSAIDLAKDILNLAKNNLSELGKLSVNDLQKIKGIGEAKAVLISAALELGKRREMASPLEHVCIRSSFDISHYLKALLKDYRHEVFVVLFLNRANRIKHFEIVSQGGLTATIADPRIILKKAVEKDATSIILSHNHPSGNLKPSLADEELTNKIKNAASYFDIRVLDHIIVSENGFFSFADEGLI